MTIQPEAGVVPIPPTYGDLVSPVSVDKFSQRLEGYDAESFMTMRHEVRTAPYPDPIQVLYTMRHSRLDQSEADNDAAFEMGLVLGSRMVDEAAAFEGKPKTAIALSDHHLIHTALETLIVLDVLEPAKIDDRLCRRNPMFVAAYYDSQRAAIGVLPGFGSFRDRLKLLQGFAHMVITLDTLTVPEA